jgi:hypothetical protein
VSLVADDCRSWHGPAACSAAGALPESGVKLPPAAVLASAESDPIPRFESRRRCSTIRVVSDNHDTALERYVRELSAASYPRADHLSGVLGFRRKWVLRVSAKLPMADALDDAVKSFVLSARQEIANALGAESYLEDPLPRASAIRIDDHHLVIEIDCPTGRATAGDSPAIVTAVMLTAADRHWQLEDLQGIPRRYVYSWAMRAKSVRLRCASRAGMSAFGT